MTWLQRYRINRFLRDSVWLPPLLGMVVALLVHPLVRRADQILDLKAAIGPESARAVLAALASSMLTFIVFVFSIMLVTVQLASAQLTPRIIATFFRSGILRFSLTVFVFAFAYTLMALSRIEDTVPQISVWIATYSSAACVGIFLYMIDRVGKSLRPVSVLTRVGNTGQEVIQDVYPLPVAGTEDAPSNVALVPEGATSRTVKTNRTGVVLAFDVAGLVELARRADCLIEFVPQVGDFVTSGGPLFRLYGGGEVVSDSLLDQAVAIGPERTMEQDPEFAFRIIVDIAAKALSPAINDPTTAVLALDQIHRLLRAVGERQLDTGRIHDAHRAAAARLSHAGLGRLRQPGDHRDQAVWRQQHSDRPPDACDAGKPDRDGAAASSGSAARGTGASRSWRGTGFPRSRRPRSRRLRRFAGCRRSNVIREGAMVSIASSGCFLTIERRL